MTKPRLGDAYQCERKFPHIWRYGDGQWQLTQAASYDHHSIDTGVK